jgi:hypothetical protein
MPVRNLSNILDNYYALEHSLRAIPSSIVSSFRTTGFVETLSSDIAFPLLTNRAEASVNLCYNSTKQRPFLPQAEFLSPLLILSYSRFVRTAHIQATNIKIAVNRNAMK